MAALEHLRTTKMPPGLFVVIDHKIYVWESIWWNWRRCSDCIGILVRREEHRTLHATIDFFKDSTAIEQS